MLNLVSAILREERGRRRECFSKGFYLRRYVTFSVEKVLVILPEQLFKCINLLNQMIMLAL